MIYPHVITIESYTESNDDLGGHSEDWAPFLTDIEAHIQPISGTEYYQAQQIQNPVQVDIYTPYNGVIQANMRIVFEGKTLNIKSVLDQGGMNEVMLLKCSYFQ